MKRLRTPSVRQWCGWLVARSSVSPFVEIIKLTPRPSGCVMSGCRDHGNFELLDISVNYHVHIRDYATDAGC
jgi:hypothetical protein